MSSDLKEYLVERAATGLVLIVLTFLTGPFIGVFQFWRLVFLVVLVSCINLFAPQCWLILKPFPKYLRLILICQTAFQARSKPAAMLCELYWNCIETNSTITSGVSTHSLLQWNRYLHVKRDETFITVTRRETQLLHGETAIFPMCGIVA